MEIKTSNYNTHKRSSLWSINSFATTASKGLSLVLVIIFFFLIILSGRTESQPSIIQHNLSNQRLEALHESQSIKLLE